MSADRSSCALRIIAVVFFIFPFAVHGQPGKFNEADVGFKFHASSQIGPFITYYMGRGRAKMELGIKRSGQFIEMARKIFREEGVPEELVWIAQIQSAWQPSAEGGLWGINKVAKNRFYLRRTAYLDECKSFEKSTRIAAKYLKWLSECYNKNWELVLGAYGCGEGHINRAVTRVGVTDFWAAYPYLPTDARNFVPNILAVIIINKNPASYGFSKVRPLSPLQYETVQMPGGISLNSIARLTNLTPSWLRYLNPELKQAITPTGEIYPVRIPPNKAKDVIAHFKVRPAKQQFLIVLRVVPSLYDEKNWTERENKLVEEHFAQLQKLLTEGKLILAGRTNVRESTGMVILEVETEAEARAIMENDAAVKGRVMTAELFPYKVALKK